MAIKVTVGQTTFIKKIVIGTPVSTARESLSLDEFSDFDVGTKSDGQILVYDSAEGAFKNYTLATGNGVEKLLNTSTDRLQIQLDSESSPILSGLTLKGHLLPGQDSSFDLGDSAVKFRDLYLSGSTIHLGGLKLKDSSGGFSVKDSAGSSVNFDLAGSRAQIRSFFSGQGDLTYDSATGVFQFDVEDVYTKANFDSDFNLALDSAALEGAGLKYTNATNTLAIDSSELYSLFKHDDFDDFVADEHVAHSGVTITAGAGLTGGGTIASSRTIDVVGGKGIIANANDIQVDSANIRGMFIANKGLSYDSETGTFNIDSDNIRGMFIGNKGFTYDSELGTFDIDSANVRGMFSGGAGIADSVNVNGVVRIDSSELYSLFKHNDFSDHVPDEHVPHGQISITAGKGLTGGGTIASTRTIDVDSANLVTMSRNALSGTNGISYTAGTGVIRAPQPLDSAATPVFTTVNANINADSGHITTLSAETIQRTSVVTAATYGSATKIPVLIVDSSGFIDSASTVDVAGVSSTSFDSQDGILTINTADGQAFTTIIADSNFTNYRARLALSGGTGITYNSATGAIVTNDGEIVHDNLSGFVANEHIDHTAVSITAGTGLKGGGTIASTRDLAIDSAELYSLYKHDDFGDFVADEHVAHSGVTITAGVGLKGGGTIESTRDLAIDSAELLTYYEPILRHDNLSGFVANEHIDHSGVTITAGVGLKGGGTIVSTRDLAIDSSELLTYYEPILRHDNLSGFVADEHVAHGGVSIIAGKGLSGGGTIASSRTIDVDSANLVTLARNALSGTNGISYTSGTGVIRAAQPLDSSANPTFNQLRGPSVFVIDPAAIGDATGTVRILGDLTVDGVTTTINSTTVSLNDKNIVIADSAADSSALSSGGITWGGSNIVFRPSFVYNHGTAAFDVNRNITSTGQVAGATLSGTLATAAQPNVTSLGTLTGLNADSARITTLTVPQSGQVQIYADGTTIGGLGSNIVANSALYIFDDNNNRLGFDGNEITASHSLFLNAGAGGGDVQIASNQEPMIVASGNEGVQLYYNNAEKFITTDSGVNITGDIRLGNVDFTNNGIIDSARLPLGTFAAGGGGGGTGNLDSALAIDLLTKNVIRFGTDIQFDSADGILFDVSDKALKVKSDLYALKLVDNAEIRLGDQNDVEIRHTGSRFELYNATGDVIIRANEDDKDVVLQADNGSGGISQYFRADGSTGEAKAYYYGSEKFKTSAYGATVTGTVNADSATLSGMLKARNGAISLNNEDSDVFSTLIVGERTNNDGFASLAFNPASNTLSAKIDATSTYIAVWSGKNSTQGQRFNINYATADETVNLRPNAVTRLEANKYGVTVTGTMNADSATISGPLKVNVDADASAEIGRAHVGYVGWSDLAGFSHIDQDTQTSYSLLQGSTGKTYLNSAAGQSTSLRVNNTTVASVAAGGVTVTGTMNADSATISGDITASKLRLTATGDASLSSTGHAFQVGPTSGANVIIDQNEVIGRQNGSTDQLNLQTNGGVLRIGDQNSSTVLSINGDVRFDSDNGILFDFSDKALEVNSSLYSINLVDDARIKFGTGNDLNIYHSSGNSVIRENNAGPLYIQTSNASTGIALTKNGATETMAKFIADGAVELYHNGNKKLETTSTGVTVTGLLSATTKSFDIEHPTKEGMRLRYGSLEGPENGVYVRGRATSNIIELPEYWTGLVDEDTITVELTPIGKHQKLYVKDIADNKIMIGNDNLINKKINCFYIVYGERKDVDKITVEY